MGKKDKKKGKGAEKTAAKTEKKALNKVKKELAAKGEDDIEKLIAEFQEKDKSIAYVGEERCEPPSPRSGFSLCSHPEKDELLLFGGEYFNGSKTEMFNDLFFYNIKKNVWSILKCNLKPPPRCSHQAVTLSQNGGQMWIFGGEFASPTRSNFYHYKDLWVFHFAEKRWEQIKCSGGPSSRSGHRMVGTRKRLTVFGGFHESIRDYKYFNDVYLFDLETYQWNKIEPSGNGPCPRSGCQMIAFSESKFLIYGGYSREKVKKDVDKGRVYNDMYFLQCDEKTVPVRWKWVSVKQTGIPPFPRSGFSLTVAPNNKAIFFGGVHDEEENEEELQGIFHNDMFTLEMETGRWIPLTLRGKSENIDKKRRRKAKDEIQTSNQDVEMDDCNVENLNIDDCMESEEEEIEAYSDSVFTVKIGKKQSQSVEEPTCSSGSGDSKVQLFMPHPRMNAAMVVKHSTLYLYGGIYEDGDKQFTLSDFYSLDLHKCDEWTILIPSNLDELEWCESTSEEESDDASSNEDIDSEETEEN